MPDPGIYQYSSNSGLAATAALTVGQTTYSPLPSIPVDLDITVSSDPQINFSQFSLNIAFTSTNNTVVGALPSLAWTGTFFANGSLPAALPSISGASQASMIVGVEFVETTYPLTSVSGCSTAPPPTGQTSLKLTLMHKGNFIQGQSDATYDISVQNNGTAASSGMVTVIDALPTSLSATGMNGTGWACIFSALICTRSDSLAGGASYPPIILTTSVASNAPAQVTNQASVSMAGLAAATASDLTAILAPFVDVSTSDPFLPAIDLLGEYGITTGCQASPPMYCSTDSITEAQIAVFVVRSVMGSDNFTYTQTPYFNDVPASNLYFPWIQKLQDLGIALPCAPSQYCPDTPVTRGIMAVLIIRGRYGVATPSNYPASPYFTDVGTNHPYFPWIQKMEQLGITSGCGPATYCPDDPVTRGQMAVFIMRGEFNLLLPTTAPVLVWTSPASAPPGQTTLVTISGQNTNFSSGASQVNAGAGIAVSNVSVASPNVLTAQFTVASGATSGPRSITVTTGSDEAALPNGFHVQ
jgi:hypothetical protein